MTSHHDPAPSGSPRDPSAERGRPLALTLAPGDYGRLDRMAQALHVDPAAMVAQWVTAKLDAVWTAASVACAMGLTPRPAYAPGDRRNVPRVTDDQLVRIRALGEHRIPITAIAEQVGVSPATVRRHLGKPRAANPHPVETETTPTPESVQGA